MAIRPGYQTNFFRNLVLDPDWEADLSKEGSFQIQITINSRQDEDIRDLLGSAKPRSISLVIKMALRFALGARYVVGSYLNGNRPLNAESPSLYYIQRATPRVVYRGKTEAPKDPLKDPKDPKPPESAKKEAVKEEKKEKEKPMVAENPGFSLPDLPELGGKEKAAKQDEFSDDDILSMLDSM